MDRRRSLALIAGAAASVAGCNGFASSSGSSSSGSDGAETVTDGPTSGTETDPETVLLRNDTDRQPVWLADSEGDGRPTPRRDGRHIESLVIDSESRADRLSVADRADGSAVDSFLAATDFDTQTVFVEALRVEECFRLELCRISWQRQKVSTDYVRQSRPWDQACAADEWVFETRLVRLPDPIDADSVTVGSTSVGGGTCAGGGAPAEAAGKSEPESPNPSDTDSGTSTETNTTAGDEQ